MPGTISPQTYMIGSLSSGRSMITVCSFAMRPLAGARGTSSPS